MIRVRYAEPDDVDFVGQDGYVSAQAVARKIDAAEVLIVDIERIPVGYLRFEYLWSRVPYIALIRVQHEHQRQGVGRALLSFLENELRQAGHS